MLTLTDESIDPKVFVGYLKSTLFQWYLCKILNFDDIFDYILKTQGKSIPYIDEFENTNNIISTYISTILKLEKAFLDSLPSHKEKYDFEELSKYYDNHNIECDECFRNIDTNIFKLLALEEVEIQDIYEDIKNMNIYDYNSLKE